MPMSADYDKAGAWLTGPQSGMAQMTLGSVFGYCASTQIPIVLFAVASGLVDGCSGYNGLALV